MKKKMEEHRSGILVRTRHLLPTHARWVGREWECKVLVWGGVISEVGWYLCVAPRRFGHVQALIAVRGD